MKAQDKCCWISSSNNMEVVAVGNENYGFIYLSYKTTSMSVECEGHDDDDCEREKGSRWVGELCW